MLLSRSSIFLEVIEGLSKSIHISEGDEQAMAKEILYKASHFLKISRVNSWLIDDDASKLTCLLAYDREKDSFYQEIELLASDLPIYFNHVRRSDIIISYDAKKEPFNAEILDAYLIPHNVRSMMEVPILSGGKFKGIVCFENTEVLREWSNDEQHFAIALTQLLTLTLETKEKNLYRDALEKLVKEKSVLIAEINHRVKNNLAVITALIRFESLRVKDDYHKELFDNILSKSFSLSTLQDSMYQSKNYQEVNFSEFIKTLINNLNDTYGHNLNVTIDLNLEPTNIDVTKAIPCSLIINELLTNCYKHAFSSSKENKLKIHLINTPEKHYQFTIQDNGPGLPDDYQKKGTGIELVDGLIEQIDGDLKTETSQKGTVFTLSF